MFRWYSRLLVRHPYLVALGVAVISSVCMTVALLRPLPDFSDPRRGFETRGTELARRMVAWTNLAEAGKHLGSLTNNPSHDPQSPHFRQTPEMAGDDSDRGAIPLNEEEDDDELEDDLYSTSRTHFGGWFCGSLDKVYGRVVFSSVKVANGSASSLFSLQAIHSMCKVEADHLRTSQFQEVCQLASGSRECCRSWSLPNYLALMYNRSTCAEVQSSDVEQAIRLLQRCSRYYHSGDLFKDCDTRSCSGVPTECSQHDAVYSLMHFILDKGFLPSDNLSQTLLQYAATFLPVAHGGALMPYLTSLTPPLADNVTAVVGLGFDLKGALFDQYLVADAVYLVAAGVIIFLAMWSYTQSLLITLATILSVVMSLGLAYFVYTVLLGISFFPFMNVMAAVIAVGVGADDTFIFCKVWQRCKLSDKAGTLAKLVEDALEHSALSMLLTSLTTSVAFFANGVSHVTAVACFSIFAGMTILLNMVLMVTWIPAFVVMSERFCHCGGDGSSLAEGSWFWSCWFQLRTWCSSIMTSANRRCRVLFDHVLPCVVVRLRWFWTLLLSALAVAGAVVVCYWPGLTLPDTQQFQLLRTSHPIERYDANLASRFRFERQSQQNTSGLDDYYLVMSFVWGVLPVDNGDHLNPEDRGNLKLDAQFNLSAPESQQWMYDFCQDLRNQTFYKSTQGPLLSNCFIETFRRWMEKRRCHNAVDASDRRPCCEETSFPYPAAVYDQCQIEAVRSIRKTPSAFLASSTAAAGPWFRRGSSELAAVVVEYDSTRTFTLSHHEMAEFVESVQRWMQQRLTSAPVGVRRGWVVTDTEMFDLQTALADGTLHTIALAVSLTFLLLLLTTLDVRISVLASVTVACIIFVTVAALVLLGWRLNVLEAVAVTVAIGLSVDFTIHYSVAYRQCESAAADRETRVVCALSTVGSPIAMAALTTLTAGLCMLPSLVLAYVQIGVFLVVLTITSWSYSTLFFLSLLRICGPEKSCFQSRLRHRQSGRRSTRRATERSPRVGKTYTCPAAADTCESTLSVFSNAAVVADVDYPVLAAPPVVRVPQRGRYWSGAEGAADRCLSDAGGTTDRCLSDAGGATGMAMHVHGPMLPNSKQQEDVWIKRF